MDDIINRGYAKSTIHTSSSSNNNITVTEKKRIMIVDDELDIANLYNLSLEREFFVSLHPKRMV